MPTSQRKIDANRRNAKNFTGPRTPEGKARSSMNSVTHGITAKTLCLSTENPERLAGLVDDYLAELAPTTRVETDLVEVLISSVWRLRRARRTETALLDIQMAVDAEAVNKRHPGLDNACREALAFKALCDQSTAWQNLDRYQTRLRRDWLAAHAELRRLRAEPQDATIAPPAADDAPERNEPGILPLLQNEAKPAGAPPPPPPPPPSSPAPVAPALLQNEANPATATPPQPGPILLLRNEAKPPAATPRNAFCPCGSGQKFKRCCGTHSQPVLGGGLRRPA